MNQKIPTCSCGNRKFLLERKKVIKKTVQDKEVFIYNVPIYECSKCHITTISPFLSLTQLAISLYKKKVYHVIYHQDLISHES